MLRARSWLEEIHPETEFSGALLKVRQALGTSEIEEIANRTKISVSHLKPIEEDFQEPPGGVHPRLLRAGSGQSLKVDPLQVSRSYLKRHRAWQAQVDP
ncbi:MAG: helix-turn-helix domain-containing protein [Polyangiaceae bacterium]